MTTPAILIELGPWQQTRVTIIAANEHEEEQLDAWILSDPSLTSLCRDALKLARLPQPARKAA